MIRRGENDPEIMRSTVGMLRRLATVFPPAEADLAAALRRSAELSSGAGQYEQADAAIEESLRISRRGAARGHGRSRLQLAWSLCAQADLLRNAGRRAEAAAAARESLVLCRNGIAEDPRRCGPALLHALHTLARALDELDNSQEALALGEELVEILRRLAARRPTHNRGLANALISLSVYHGHLGRAADGLRATDEAVELYRGLDKKRPGAFATQLATVADNRDEFLAHLQRRGMVVLGPHPLCALCEPFNGGLIAVRHPQRHIRVGDRQACVDSEIADVLTALWEGGCDTVSCCQDVDGRAEVVPAAGHARRAVEILADMGIDAELTDEVVYFRR